MKGNSHLNHHENFRVTEAKVLCRERTGNGMGMDGIYGRDEIHRGVWGKTK